MYTSDDLLSSPYFNILSSDKNNYEIQSKNTKQYWKITQKNSSNYTLLHKHHKNDEYHFQCAFVTLYDIVLEIVCHDDYQLHKKRGHGTPLYAETSYFDTLIKTYGLE